MEEKDTVKANKSKIEKIGFRIWLFLGLGFLCIGIILFILENYAGFEQPANITGSGGIVIGLAILIPLILRNQNKIIR